MDSAETAKKTVRVTIYNQSYTLATSGDPATTEQLAMEVDDLMSSIARRAGNLDATRTAVLACLHIADKLRSVETELEELRKAVDDRTRDFASLLDEVLSGSS